MQMRKGNCEKGYYHTLKFHPQSEKLEPPFTEQTVPQESTAQ